MKIKRKIAIAVMFILGVFTVAFSILVFAGRVTFQLKDLKTQSTQLLSEFYRLNLEVKSIMTATAITTGELRANLVETVHDVQDSIDLVERNSRLLLSNEGLSDQLLHATNLWKTTRKDLDKIEYHMGELIRLGIDERINFISRMQYSYLRIRDQGADGTERFHLLSLENATESFTASSYSYGKVFQTLNEEIASAADGYIRFSLASAIALMAIVVAGALGFGFLFSHQALVTQLDGLIDEAKRTEEDKRRAELLALRYQINPHFLYNTLGAIRSYAVREEQQEIAEMIKVLSRLLRTTVSRTSEMVTIREEIAILKDYVAVLQIRYMRRIKFTFDMEDDLDQAIIPGLLLQPVVENAVLHGLSKRLNEAEDGDARLEVRVRSNHDTIILEVRDNGTGMDERALWEAFHGNGSEALDGHSIGIRNIQERIQKRYGRSYGITIESRKGSHTLVTIKLPRIAGDGKDAA